MGTQDIDKQKDNTQNLETLSCQLFDLFKDFEVSDEDLLSRYKEITAAARQAGFFDESDKEQWQSVMQAARWLMRHLLYGQSERAHELTLQAVSRSVDLNSELIRTMLYLDFDLCKETLFERYYPLYECDLTLRYIFDFCNLNDEKDTDIWCQIKKGIQAQLELSVDQMQRVMRWDIGFDIHEAVFGPDFLGGKCEMSSSDAHLRDSTEKSGEFEHGIPF